jgi:hypothetical protein
MRFGSRWQRVQSYTSLAAWSIAALHDDDELTWRDTPETLVLGMQLGLIWSPQIALAIGISSTPLNVVEGAALAGLAVSFAIGGIEGAETYVDYITDPVDMVRDPGKQKTLIQASDIVLSVVNPLHIPQKMLAEWIVEDLPWGEVLRNRWLTGPVLPF